MKKLMIFVSSVLMIFFLTACNSGGEQLSSVTEEKSNSISSAAKETEVSKKNGDETVAVQYKVGDIILADDSVVKPTKLITIDRSNLPVAVIAGVKNDGTAFGVGVHRSSDSLQWELDDTMDDAKDYSAFDFVNTYAETYKLTGVYASGWNIPSIEELKAVYENREIINTSLQKIYELDNRAAMDGLDTNWYWSSTQSDSKKDYAWFVHFFNGYAGECPKNFTNVHVLVVRAF